ncbi:MAG: copper resistance protein CopC [Gammaproteobacteria bacterium]|nr:copper resistance protein CopC [Gammaproteobacteria bacterium]MBV9619609.1 copper resistance protein CopC [Gammaproteobacteria bacterium]
MSARLMLLALLYAGALAAHPHLLQSTPVAGSTLTQTPAQLVLQFAEPVRLTALSLQRVGAAAQRLAGLPAQAQARIEVVLPPLPAGDYLVTYRALGADGHLVPGQLRFRLVR